MTIILKSRKVIVVNIDDIAKINKAQCLILEGRKANGSIFKVDIGRICYTIREEDSGKGLHKTKKYLTGAVDPQSLSLKRSKWLKDYLLHILSKGLRNESIRAELYQLRYFFNFCDFNGSKPTTLSDLVSNYKSYQLVLYQKGQGNNKLSYSEGVICKRLNTAREFIQVVFNLSDSNVLAIIPKPRHSSRNIHIKPRSTNLMDLQNYLQICIQVFTKFSDAILENRYPIQINPLNSSCDSMYWHSPFASELKILPNCVNEHRELISFEKLEASLARYFKRSDSSKQFYRDTLIYSRNAWLNEPLTNKKIYAYNLCVYCFFKIYIGFTAGNVQPTLDLKITDLDIKKIGLSVFAKKHKHRAGRKVDFTSSSQLKRLVVKYLKLRQWLDGLELVNKDSESFLFVTISEKRQVIRLCGNASSSTMQRSPLFKGVKNITAQDLRRLCGEYIIRQSKGNISLVAKKLNNSIATTAKSYTSIDMESQTIEMNKYHEELSFKIHQFNRSTNKTIPINILEHEESHRVASGSCTNLTESTPVRADGFNSNAPDPICGTFETCLFCKFFSIHIDFEDLHKLLSLREALLKASIIRADPEHHQFAVAPSLYRINEILKVLRERNSTIRSLILEVEQTIEMRVYNDNWDKQIEIMTKEAKKLSSESELCQE